MFFNELPTSSTCALFCSLLISLFLLRKAHRDRDATLQLCLLIDATVTVVFPIALFILDTSISVSVQKLFLLAFFFQLAVCILLFLFPSAARQLLIPFASLFLLFGVSLSFLKFNFGVSESEIGLFAYVLQDQISLAGFSVLYIAALIPLLNLASSKMNVLLTSRRLSCLSKGIEIKKVVVNGSVRDEERDPLCEDPGGSFLQKTMRLIKEGKYGLFVESCNAEVERIILSSLGSHSIKPDIPTRVEDGISLLESKGILLPRRSIFRLRELCSSLATPSKEASIDQARWAAKVVKRTAEMLGKFGGSEAHLQNARHSET